MSRRETRDGVPMDQESVVRIKRTSWAQDDQAFPGEKERAEGTEARAAIGCSLNNTGYEVGICRRPLLRSAPRTLQCPGPAGFVATLHRCTARYVPLISISKCATHIKSLYRCNAALLVRGHRFAIVLPSSLYQPRISLDIPHAQ